MDVTNDAARLHAEHTGAYGLVAVSRCNECHAVVHAEVHVGASEMKPTVLTVGVTSGVMYDGYEGHTRVRLLCLGVLFAGPLSPEHICLLGSAAR